MDELRATIGNRDVHQAQSAIAEFVVRHRLTRSDIDALVVALAQPTARSDLTHPPDSAPAPDARPTVTDVSNAASDQPELNEDAPHGDVGWMFDDDPAPPVLNAADDVVGQAFEDLLGDWTRTGGKLTRADVALLATRRSLTAAQNGELLALLADAGVELPASTNAGPVKSATKGYELHEDTVRQYLREIGRYPLIDAAREVELWSLMQQGAAAQAVLDAGGADLSAADRRSLRDRAREGARAHAALVCANLRLVVAIAKAGRYQQSGVAFADRIQDGNMGLMHAAHRFDGSMGYKFSTYATWWIKQSIERGIANHGRTIRIPVHVHEQVRKVRKAARKLADRLDGEPTLDELVDATGMAPAKVQALLDLDQPVRSIDHLLGEDDDLRLSDVLVHDEERDGRTDPASIVEHATLRGEIDRILRRVLPERAANVIRRRFGLGTGEEETLDEIGADYGITRERIRQIQGNAMKKLKMSTEIAGLRSYLVDEPSCGASAEGTIR
ncbi:sigma-70 family RNA polymerase sigma factor [Micromonospora sp. C51]|uniref:sigma-70 family RNA polymerase sigma factor n=1 Tax=Micromonospora sp. C51 TaxID=2824879 RepID=UPI001B360DD5|nr:sigma-70 family RNA polymerase sigma factor [Micromonospora sp. C51]MBQ1050807.1 sigma-70 family RNA polymerase sigma factor [Micromonospora sp. C51]